MKNLIAVAIIGFLSACATKPTLLTASFDEQAAKAQLSDGGNSIRGSALIRQAGGGVVTCAGGQVFLMPLTERAAEWSNLLYGTYSQGGFYSVSRGSIAFDSSDPLFSNTRNATCDAQGNFKFDRVANGKFLVFTRITWTAGGYLQGGSVMRPVVLQGNDSVEIVLSPT